MQTDHNQKLPSDVPEGTLLSWKYLPSGGCWWHVSKALPRFVKTLRQSMGGGGIRPSVPPWQGPSSYLVLPVGRGSVLWAVSSPKVDESKEIIDQFGSGVCKLFYFLGASAPVLPTHLDAASSVTFPHVP